MPSLHHCNGRKSDNVVFTSVQWEEVREYHLYISAIGVSQIMSSLHQWRGRHWSLEAEGCKEKPLNGRMYAKKNGKKT